LVDDKPFRVVSQNFPFARQETLRSGKNPPLPTQVPGIHEVSMNILQPKIEFKIPKIRYFVTPGEIEKRVELSISKVEDLRGNIIVVEKNRISLTKDTNYLFSGIARNLSKSEISSAILQIFLADKLFDQKMINNLKPQEQRTFETSILNDSTPQKKLSFKIFDTSVGGKILGAREMDIISTSPPTTKALLTVIEGTLWVNMDPGPQVNVMPGQPFSVEWDTSSIEGASQVEIHFGLTESWIGINALGAPSGTMNIEPSDPLEFNERRDCFGFIQDFAGSNLAMTNTIVVNAYDLTTAMKTLPGLEIVAVRAEGQLENDQVHFSIELRNNSNLERTATSMFINPCTEDVTKGLPTFDCGTTPAYSGNPNLNLPAGQIVPFEVTVPREDIDLGFVHPHISCDYIPVLFRIIVRDNLGLDDQKYSPPVQLSRTGFDLGIMECRLVDRIQFNWQALGGYMAMLNNFAKGIRIFIKLCGNSGTYDGPLPLHCHNGGINLNYPEGNVIIAQGEEISIDCELRYVFLQPRARSYAQEKLVISLELPDDYPTNNIGHSDWVINTFPVIGNQIMVKSIQIHPPSWLTVFQSGPFMWVVEII